MVHHHTLKQASKHSDPSIIVGHANYSICVVINKLAIGKNYVKIFWGLGIFWWYHKVDALVRLACYLFCGNDCIAVAWPLQGKWLKTLLIFAFWFAVREAGYGLKALLTYILKEIGKNVLTEMRLLLFLLWDYSSKILLFQVIFLPKKEGKAMD